MRRLARPAVLVLCLSELLTPFGSYGQDGGVQNPSICEIFEELDKWNGRMVEMEVEIEGRKGFEGEAWISGSACPSKLQWNGVKFGNTLVIQYPMNKESIEHAVNFTMDDQSLQEWYRVFARLKPGHFTLRARVLGMIETRVPLSRLVSISTQHPNGIQMGFGHLNGHPAQLIVKSLKDLRIVSEPH